jgi:hypothetical protein
VDPYSVLIEEPLSVILESHNIMQNRGKTTLGPKHQCIIRTNKILLSCECQVAELVKYFVIMREIRDQLPTNLGMTCKGWKTATSHS